MNYAQDLHHKDLFTQVTRWLATPVSGQCSEKWLLFDGAILGKKLTNTIIGMLPPNDVHNVFSNTKFSPYGLYAPHLVRLNFSSYGSNTLHTLLRYTVGLPAVAFLDASADADQVCCHLSWLADVKTGDGLEIYCRLADTRITPVLMEVLSIHQRSVLQKCIGNWQVVNRRGELRPVLVNANSTHIVLTTSEDAVSISKQLILSDEQYILMMRSAEADEIFQMLAEGASDLLPEEYSGIFHSRLSGLVTAARQIGLEKTSDIYQFSVIALTTRDDFFLDFVLEEYWKRLSDGACTFPSMVGSWSDEIWAALAQTDHSELLETGKTGANT